MPSPYVYEAKDYQDNAIRGAFNYDDATGTLLSLDAHRDADCVYTTIVIGVGPDNTVETSTQRYLVPVGDSTVTQAELNAEGLYHIDDVTDLQITAIS